MALLVEMARFELASEDLFPKPSTSVVYLLSFPFKTADKQAELKGSPLSPYKLQGSHLCRCTAKMTPLTESRYFQSGWAAIKQQLKLFYYCQLFLSCDFYSGATPLLAYLGSKSPSKSFHPHIFRFAQVKREKWIVKIYCLWIYLLNSFIERSMFLSASRFAAVSRLS